MICDRHNLIHAYGHTARFASTLRALGFQEGTPNASFAHAHHCRSECDADAACVLTAFEWRYSPLQPEDEQ